MDVNIESENVEEKQQLAILEEEVDEMSVPNWLIDVLKWIIRIQMANSSLSFSCKFFKRLCWPKLHGNVNPHFIQSLVYRYDGPADKSGNICATLKNCHKQIIPIAAIPPPKYIQGFSRIIIRFLDIRIIEFVKIAVSKEIDFSTKTSMQKLEKNEEQLTLFHNLLTILVNNIFILRMNTHFDSNSFLTKLVYYCIIEELFN